MASAIKRTPLDKLARQRHIDSLVATYAPIGQRRRRAAVRKRIAAVFALSAFMTAGSAIWLSGIPLVPAWQSDEERFAELRNMLTAELDAINAERRELERYKLMFEEQNDRLRAQIDAVDAKWTDLEAQRQKFEEQSTLLAERITDIDSEQRNLEQQGDPDRMLNEEINAIAAQRQALEKRWKQFEAQGELLATEIIAVNAQRRELEAQRQLMEEQQAKLEALIDRAIDNDDRSHRAPGGRSGTETAGTVPEPEPEQIAYASTSAVGEDALGEMRGGISMGGGLEVALGITHSGSINGIEQYSNNFVIDDLNGDVSKVDLSKVHSTLVQNGDGNFAAPNIFDSMSNGFAHTIQNTLDDQVISTTSIYDISIGNTDAAMQGLAAAQALSNSLDLSH